MYYTSSYIIYIFNEDYMGFKGGFLRFLYKIGIKKWKNSGDFWEERYLFGGNSGSGSYNNLANFKADFLNEFVVKESISSVIEWGCGDGNQLSLANYDNYLGYDVSKTAIDICRKRFKHDRSKEFVCTAEDGFISKKKADLVLSLDVIYHLVEDDIFEKYMKDLFDSSSRFVCIYSSNTEENNSNIRHVRHRKFTKYIEDKFTDFSLYSFTPNKYPYDENNPDKTSFADFYVYKKILDC